MAKAEHKRDYYEVLGVERSAGAEEIKQAYRKLLLVVAELQTPTDISAEQRELLKQFSKLESERKRTSSRA